MLNTGELTDAETIGAIASGIADPAIRDGLAVYLKRMRILTEQQIDDGTLLMDQFHFDQELALGKQVVKAMAEAIPTPELGETLGTMTADCHLAYTPSYSLGKIPAYPLASSAYATLLRWATTE